jgi:hypothetical protein
MFPELTLERRIYMVTLGNHLKLIRTTHNPFRSEYFTRQFAHTSFVNTHNKQHFAKCLYSF